MTDTKPDRYRDTQRSTLPRKLLAITLGALAIATAAALAVVGYQRFATAEVKGDLYGYEVLDDQTVSVKFSVTRSDPSRPAACIVRVRSSDGSETGRREISFPVGVGDRPGDDDREIFPAACHGRRLRLRQRRP